MMITTAVNRIQSLLQGPMNVFPWLKHIIPGMIGYTNAMNGIGGVMDIAQEAYEDHIKTFQVNCLLLHFYLSKLTSTL